MISCALIGCGYWGSKLQRYIMDNKTLDLRYVCNSESNLEEVWNDKQITAVIVATPNETHYSIVKAALEHNKHVLSEKPLALKTTECQELRRLALDTNQMLIVEYTYTFSKALKKAQDEINNNKIGAILGLDMSVKHLGRFGGGNVYWLLGSHMLSILNMFIPLKELEFKRQDLVSINGIVETGIIYFGNKPSGQINISLNYPGKETKVIIYGETGTIIYNPTTHFVLQVINYQKPKWTVNIPQNFQKSYINETNNLKYAIQEFVDGIEGKVESNIDTAVEITHILETLSEDLCQQSV